jgi:xanthine dehydrogenase accessory factor
VAEDLLARAADLRRRGVSFVLATVVRCEAPTSAKSGAKALVFEDGTVEGWVGGACAEPVVVRESRHALRDGQPRLVAVSGSAGPSREGRSEGIVEYPMTCHSGGTLEIYVEPYLPKPLLALVGHGPILEALAVLGRDADFGVEMFGAEAFGERLGQLSLSRRASVVVATHADSDEDVLGQVLQSDAGYISVVASRKRAAVIVERLRQRGVSADRIGRIKAPAGLDIGAVTPREIAISILAEMVQHRRSAKVAEPSLDDAVGSADASASPGGASVELAATEALDPICGMFVEVATAAYRSEIDGQSVYFCCRGCKERFDADPAAYIGALRSGIRTDPTTLRAPPSPAPSPRGSAAPSA